MQIEGSSPEQYISEAPAEKREALQNLRKSILENLPKGFEEIMNYKMIGYVVPHSIFPEGYHCDPKLPLPFAHLANQKNYLALYHSGIYADAELRNWFIKSYKSMTGKKPDMGKSCVRFRNMQQIPYNLIGELMTRFSVEEWVALYQNR